MVLFVSPKMSKNEKYFPLIINDMRDNGFTCPGGVPRQGCGAQAGR